MVIYNHKTKLLKEHRTLLTTTTERLGVHPPLSIAKLFKHATVEFLTQEGKDRATGVVVPVYTICILENRGKRVIGIAKLGTPHHSKKYETWNDAVGQTIAFTRAVRQYFDYNPYPRHERNGMTNSGLRYYALTSPCGHK